jgi:hypothetical protein
MRRGDLRVTAQVGDKTFRLINQLAEDRQESRASVVRTVLDRYAYAFQLKDERLRVGDEHLALISPTKHGKTYLTIHYLIPHVTQNRRVVVLDPHGEYGNGYEQVPLRYEHTVPPSSNQLFETIQLQNLWSDASHVVNELIQRIATSKRKRIAIRLDILDHEADRMIVSEFLKRITNRMWRPAITVVVEEANKYDCKALVSRGRHSNIQTILISQYPLEAETMSNVRVVLGPINPKLVEAIDPTITYALLELKQGQFIWEHAKGRWRRFNYAR